MSRDPRAILARWCNLFVPGAGLVLLGRAWTGLAAALIFAALTCTGLAAYLILPEDVPAWLGGASLAGAAAVYAGAQFGVRAAERRGRELHAQARRREVLGTVRRLIEEGEYERALGELRAFGDAIERDLLLAVRLAQVLSRGGDRDAAARAWRRVRELDRHKLYRGEVEAHRHLWEAGSDARHADAARGPEG